MEGAATPGASGEGLMFFSGGTVNLYGEPSPVSSSVTLGAGDVLAVELHISWGGENGFNLSLSYGRGVGEIATYNPLALTIDKKLVDIPSGLPCVGKP